MSFSMPMQTGASQAGIGGKYQVSIKPVITEQDPGTHNLILPIIHTHAILTEKFTIKATYTNISAFVDIYSIHPS